jgi:hypothetical protein
MALTESGAYTGAFGLEALGSILGGYAQSRAQREWGKYQEHLAGINARFAEIQAEDTIKRGGVQASRYRSQIEQVIGTQRTMLAAQGLDFTRGSAFDVQNDTRATGEVDMDTIRTNAKLEALGFKAQAANFRHEGKVANITSKYQSRNTLLTGITSGVASGIRAYGAYEAGGGKMWSKEGKPK